MEDNNSVCPYGKICTVANYVGTSVVSAFFTSLERCSCINLSTSDNDDEEEAKDRPLMFRSSGRQALPTPAASQPASVDTLPV
ncbi:hypothetical protein Nepgr_010714 [Nepenthes gracilis]|uniref:Uncharacterized protein n=1 Tax=Nepenthes gracilis TaxID=150966 RepID=A0AAD3SDG0_NEPGR|nr:hypothetical protein Nepgr_010714 [Nepenthes gracilis]